MMGKCEFEPLSIKKVFKAVLLYGVGTWVVILTMPMWLPILFSIKMIQWIFIACVGTWEWLRFEAKVILVCAIIYFILM